MATKSKKSKLYRLRYKGIAVFLFFTFAVSIFFCGIVGVNISRNWSWDVINADTVYDTEEFREAFSRTLDRAVQADIYYQNEDRVSKGAAVDRNDLLNGFKRYYGIIDGIITGNTEINAAYDGLLLHGEIPESLQGNLEEYRNLVESRLPAYYKMYIQRQLDEYKNCIRYLEGVRNFLYYVEDENGNVVGGNAAKGEISQEARTLVLSAGFSSDHLGENPYYFDTYENPVLEKSNFKFYGAIRDPLLPGDEFYDLWQGFGFAKKSIPILSCVSAVSLLGMLLSVIYLVRVTGQTERRGKIQLGMVDRLYNEVHFLLVAFFGCIAGFTAHTLVDTIRQGAVLFWNYVFATILGVLYLVTAAILLNYLLSVARQLKNKSFFRNTWISVSIRRMSELFTGSTFRGWMVIVMLCYALGNCVIMGVMVMAPYYGYAELAVLAGVVLVCFNGLCMYWFVRALRSLKEIMISVKESAKGNFSYQLDLNKISPSFLNFAEDVANIQEGFKNAVDDAVKGERMKAELITNVSHDLKTPLTSILSYSELLMQEPLEGAASDYAQIIQQKALRLKSMVQDVFEISKAASDQLPVKPEVLDFGKLLRQTLADMDGEIQKSGLTFKLDLPEQPVEITADGTRLYRVFQNLLQNALNYSLPGSRVYLSLKTTGKAAVASLRNTSRNELPEGVDFTARFVRGDESRTDGGTGLGLSVAKSFTEACGGTFRVETMADLFTVIVSFPVSMHKPKQ